MEDYYIALSPDFELSSKEFVTAWNEEKECRAVAAAHLVQPASQQQYDISLAADILLGLATNIASNVLYDLIKKALTKRGVINKHIHIEALQKSDGTRFLVVDSDEE